MKHPILFAAGLFALVGVASGAIGAYLALRSMGGMQQCAPESEPEPQMLPLQTANVHPAHETIQ